MQYSALLGAAAFIVIRSIFVYPKSMVVRLECNTTYVTREYLLDQSR